MQPLSAWPLSARQGLVGVFTDIDDTLTRHGAITPEALQALAELRAAGLKVVAITGRPVGWCERFARGDGPSAMPPWPLDALVTENGAVAWVPGPQGMVKAYQQSRAVRARNRARMRAVADRVLRSIPAAQLTRDHAGRETDLAFDAAEFAQLSAQDIARIVALLRAEGMHTTVSSIHIHGCFGLFNKWQGACWLVRTLWGVHLPTDRAQWAFVGDSGNDVPLFEQLENSIGVANLGPLAHQLSHLPAYITPSERGAGFAEVAAAILSARAA